LSLLKFQPSYEGSGTQSDLLTIGIKMSETCWDATDYQ